MLRKNIIFVMTILIVLGFLLTSCGDTTNSQNNTSGVYHLAHIDSMPAEVQAAPKVVQTAYQFAAENPDVLKGIPCYCGCGAMGHTSNYSCYIAGENQDGALTFDNHALGCTICVDITTDAIRLLEDGKPLPDIRAYIDQTYSQFGPSNIP